MKDNLHACIQLVFGHEGGYVNNPRDPGGPTKYGITLKTLSAWRKKRVTAADVRALTLAEAGEILDAQYWRKVWGDRLPKGVDLALFDYAVNSGPGQAVKTLQRIVGTDRDGVMGVITLEAVQKRAATSVIHDLCAARLKFLRGLRTWRTFGKGWQNRVDRVRKQSLAMVDKTPATIVAAAQGDAPPETAEADPKETATTSTAHGQSSVVTLLGTVGGAAGTAGTALQAVSEGNGSLTKLFVVMTALCFAAAVIGALWGFVAERRRIASGAPI